MKELYNCFLKQSHYYKTQQIKQRALMLNSMQQEVTLSCKRDNSSVHFMISQQLLDLMNIMLLIMELEVIVYFS